MTGHAGALPEKIRSARSTGDLPAGRLLTSFRTLGELLRHRAENSPDQTWLVFHPDAGPRSPMTYGEIYTRVCRAARYLLEQGIGRGTRVATVSHNHSDTVIQYLACWSIGAVVVPVNVGEDDSRIAYILENSDSRIAFVRREYLDRLTSIIGGLPHGPVIVACGEESPVPGPGRPDGGPGRTARDLFGDVVSSGDDTPVESAGVLPDDEALIVYTSGTTGNPKGVLLSQYNLLADAMAIAAWHGMTPGQRMMCVLPIHHVNGIVVTLVTPMYYDGAVVLNQKFHTGEFFRRIVDEDVTVVSVVPTLLQFLLHAATDGPVPDFGGLRHIICGAGPLTCELALNFEEKFGIPIVHGYGLSETTCYSCFLPPDLPAAEHTHWLREYGFPSIGTPLPVNEMDIHDAAGNPCGEGNRGEIVIRGHNVMKEYFSNPEANEETFAHGWFRSGDEGFYRTDGRGRKFFFITGRLKELIIRGGINISPLEIDGVLMNLPGVKTALAVGFDNDWYGEEVGAYVQRLPGSAVSEDDIIGGCRKFFPWQKCPKVVLFGENIPVTSTGKYQRTKLKHLFAEWKGVQFHGKKINR
jgi:long-chain acyl-CoA synthetase